jgi:hypothetical protein
MREGRRSCAAEAAAHRSCAPRSGGEGGQWRPPHQGREGTGGGRASWRRGRGREREATLQDRSGELEMGEWMGADENSTQEFGLWTQFHSDTSASFSCQIHVVTGVLLDLGARSNQQPLQTRSGKHHETASDNQNGPAGFWNRLDRPSGT